jgi:Ring finger domain
MAGSQSYQTVYGSPLLDDIHNYFPQLLYRSEQFQTLTQVFAYVHRQIDAHFNLGARGLRLYRESELQAPHTYFVPTPMVVPTPSVRVDLDVEPLTSISEIAALMPLIQRFMTPQASQLRPRQEDVVVHASNEVIQRASTERTLNADSDEFCSICQDIMHEGEMLRRLTVCQHEFHRSCIDNWLLNRSVRCPTCRFDVRETGRVSATRSPLLAPAAAAAAGCPTGPSMSLDSSRPSVSGPSVSGPSVSGPSVSGPSVSGPSVSGPVVPPRTNPRLRSDLASWDIPSTWNAPSTSTHSPASTTPR